MCQYISLSAQGKASCNHPSSRALGKAGRRDPEDQTQSLDLGRNTLYNVSHPVFVKLS